MGKIVACPTAGSCGILPAVLLTAGEQLNKTDEELIQALFAAAAIGLIIGRNATFSGAEGGCQAECGSAAAAEFAQCPHYPRQRRGPPGCCPRRRRAIRGLPLVYVHADPGGQGLARRPAGGADLHLRGRRYPHGTLVAGVCGKIPA